MNYPPAPRGPATDVFQSAKHGTVEVPNPYAWLEDQKSTEYHSFVQAQNETFDDYISHPSLASSRENLQKTLSDLHALPSPISLPRRVGAWYYYRASGHGRTYPVTYRSKTLDFASPEIFHDEAAEGDAGAAMISSGFSKTGRYWAYWSSIRGSEVGYLRVRDTTSPTGERTEDTVRGVKFTGREAGIKWVGDGGFLYQYWPEEETGKGKKGPQLRFHKLGEEQERDEAVYEDPGNPGYTFWASVDGDGEWVFLMVVRAGRNNQLWGARVSETEGMDGDLKFDVEIEAGWGAEVKYIGTRGTSLLFHSTAENGQVFGVDKVTYKREGVIPPNEKRTLKLVRMVKNGFLAVYSIHVHDEIYLLSPSGGAITRIAPAILTVLDIGVNQGDDDFFILESTFYSPPAVWHGRLPASVSAAETPASPISLFKDRQLSSAPSFRTRQIFYPSLDRTKIPMFITSNPSLPITKKTPVLLYIYGAYSISVIPHFRPDFLAFLRSFNGVLAIANVRGGGEYGPSWNAAARKEKRQVLFNDVISGIRYLKEELGSEEVVLMGESMGALNAAAVMMQVPELLKGVFLNVGVLDVLRKERLGMRDRGSDDVGSAEVPGEFDSMVKWAPMENLGVGVGRKYPSVLLTAGERDEVVSAVHSVKMTAALQFALGGEGEDGEGEGKGVVGLRIMRDAGHGVGNSGEVKKRASLGRWLWACRALRWRVVGGGERGAEDKGGNIKSEIHIPSA